MNGLGIGNRQCQWCGVKTLYLQEHHYPVLKSKGGKDIVSICANCHSEFHNKLFIGLVKNEEVKE